MNRRYLHICEMSHELLARGVGQYNAPPSSCLKPFEFAVHSVWNAFPPGNCMLTCTSPVSYPYLLFLQPFSVFIVHI